MSTIVIGIDNSIAEVARDEGIRQEVEDITDNDVVDTTQHAGLARKVARLRPLGVVKG